MTTSMDGEANQTSESTKTKLTTTKLMAVFFVQLNEAYQISVLLPIVVFMCRDFGISSEYLGVYSSILNACFGFCQFLVSYVWGYLSDIHGRRRILMVGLLGSWIASVVFGFSTSFKMAVAARCLTGLFQGNLGVVKAYLADVTNSENRAFAFSMIGGSIGIGFVLGSMLGGILIITNDVDVPDADYIATTSVLKWWIFEEQYPFLLPTGVFGGIIAVNALIWTYIFIFDEREYPEHEYLSDSTSSSGTSSMPQVLMEETDGFNHSITTIGALSVQSVEMTSNVSAPQFYLSPDGDQGTRHRKSTTFHEMMVLERVHDGEYLAAHQSLPTFADVQSMIGSIKPDKMKLLDRARSTETFGSDSDEPYIASTRDMFSKTYLGHSLLNYGIAVPQFCGVPFDLLHSAISHMMFKEMGPVFMAQALLFNSAYIGYTQAYSGLCLFIFTFCIQPWCLRKFCNKWLAVSCVAICFFAMFWMPSIYYFTHIDDDDTRYGFMSDPLWLLGMCLLVEQTLCCAVSPVFVTSSCWVNNSVPQHCLGKANGIGQAMAAFVRGFGPLLTGFIWSGSYVQIEQGFAYAVYWAYLPGALLYLVALADIALFVPPSLNFTWEQRKQNGIKW